MKTRTRSTRCSRPRRAVDVIVDEMRLRPFGGRTELDVHRELVERMLAPGTSEPTSRSSPPGLRRKPPPRAVAERVIERATSSCATSAARMRHYCSDITRMFLVGEPSSEVRDTYAVLEDAQEAGGAARAVGTPCEEVDAAARR